MHVTAAEEGFFDIFSSVLRHTVPTLNFIYLTVCAGVKLMNVGMCGVITAAFAFFLCVPLCLPFLNECLWPALIIVQSFILTKWGARELAHPQGVFHDEKKILKAGREGNKQWYNDVAEDFWAALMLFYTSTLDLLMFEKPANKA